MPERKTSINFIDPKNPPKDYLPSKGKGVSTNRGWLERGLAGLDYLANISRSTIKGALDPTDSALGNLKEAATRDLYTSPEELKDTLYKRTIDALDMQDIAPSKLRFGKDNSKFEAGDVLDFAADFALDLATDPLSWTGIGGVGKALKGGKVAATAQKVVKYMPESTIKKLGKPAYNALKKAAKPAELIDSKLLKPALGGMYGYAISEPDDSFGRKALYTLGGAATAYYGIKNKDKIKKITKNVFDGLDKFTEWSRKAIQKDPESAMGLAEALRIATEAGEKIRDITLFAVQGRAKALKNLTDAEVVTTESIIRNFKDTFIKRRNQTLEKASGMNIENLTDAYRKGDKTIKAKFDELNRAVSRKVQHDMEKEYVPKILKEQETKIKDAVKLWEDHNINIVKKINQETNRELVGIKWHIDDVYQPAEFDDLADIYKGLVPRSDKFKLAKGTGKRELSARAVLSGDEAYKIYAERLGRQFLSDEQRKAFNVIAGAEEGLDKASNLNKFFKTYDRLTRFMKSNMLGATITWLRTNMYDNFMKAFVESGLVTSIKTGLLGMNKKLIKDIDSVMKGDISRKILDENSLDLLKRGVIENTMFTTMRKVDDETLRFAKSPQKFQEYLKAQADKGKGVGGKVANAMDKWEAMLGNTTFRLGSIMEGTARATVYKHTYDMLKQSDEIVNTLKKSYLSKPGIDRAKKLAEVDAIVDSSLKDVAAEITKKTFFDYGKVRYFEKAVMKRAIPFWTFFSRNIPYWVQTAFDVEKIGRFSISNKIRKNIGRDLTEDERKEIAPYLLNNAPRLIGRTIKGKKYFIMPYMSSYDAINSINPQEAVSQFVEKAHPLLKTPLELALDRDWFTGGYFFPSSARTEREKRLDKQGEKFMFTQGYKWMYMQDLARSLGLSYDVIEVDRNGNPINKNDAMAVIDKIQSTLLPIGVIDQLIGAYGKVKEGKKTKAEAIIEFALPVKMPTVSRKAARYIKMQREGSRKPIE